MSTVNDLLIKIDAVKTTYDNKMEKLKAQLEKAYKKEIKSCENIRQAWEIYKFIPVELMEHDSWANDRDYTINYEYTFYDVLDQEIKEEVGFNLISYIDNSYEDYPNSYTITEDDIRFFFEEQCREDITVFSRKLKKDIKVQIPYDVLVQWMEKLINERIVSIQVPTYW